MTAEDARKLNAEYIQKLFLGNADIDKKIDVAARAGKTDIYVSLDSIEYRLRDSAFEDLKKIYESPPRSFVVTRQRVSGDFRESGSDGITISWK